MKLVNYSTATFAGFLISFVAIVVNALVFADINNKIGAVDAETARLNEALREQTANGNEAETKFQNYRMMYNLASLVAADKRASAEDDATVLLNEALTFLFAAANEVSVTGIRRAEAEMQVSEEAVQLYEEAKAATDSGQKSQGESASTNDGKKDKREKAEIEKAEKEKAEKDLEAALNELEASSTENVDNLSKKIAAIETISVAAAAAENDNEFFVRIFPVNKALSARWVESVNRKEKRLGELETDKRLLIKYQGYSTFAALALQMLGLMFVFLKDMLEIRESGAQQNL